MAHHQLVAQRARAGRENAHRFLSHDSKAGHGGGRDTSGTTQVSPGLIELAGNQVGYLHRGHACLSPRVCWTRDELGAARFALAVT